MLCASANSPWSRSKPINTFRNCNKHGAEHASIFVHGDGAVGNRNIVIENNRFESGPSGYVLNLQWADGIDIRSNTFINAPQPAAKPPSSVLWLTHCRNVTLLDNTVRNLGPYAGKLVGEGPDVSGIRNNNSAGIRQASPGLP
jgi:hypothetical protein